MIKIKEKISGSFASFKGREIFCRSRISKAGSRLYRGALFMSAMVAIRFNDEIKVFYNRLKDNGKHTTVAQVAVIKKLIIIAHSLYKNDCAYDADLEKVEKWHCLLKFGFICYYVRIIEELKGILRWQLTLRTISHHQ